MYLFSIKLKTSSPCNTPLPPFFTGNEDGKFGLQKYGFSKVIIYNRKTLDETKYRHLKVIGTAVLVLGRRIVFEYNLHAFFYVM